MVSKPQTKNRTHPVNKKFVQQESKMNSIFQQGFSAHQKGELAQAKAAYEQVLAIQPKHFDALHLLGIVASQTKNFDLAQELIGKAIKLRPNAAGAYSNRGIALRELKRLDEAIASYDQAIAINPDYAEAYGNRGNVLKELKRFDEALASYDHAIAIKPDYAEAFSNRGNILQELKRLDQALESYEKAIAIKPDFVEVFFNRGTALKELHRLDEAIASFDQAIAIKPDHVDAHWNKSLAALLSGDFKIGWKLYEWRWKKDNFISTKRKFLQPLWLGVGALKDKTILLHAEQGLGDTIQFCKYAKLVADLGARVLLEVPRSLKTLLSDLAGVAQVLEAGQPLPDFDFHCPLLSLPLAFKTELTAMPSPAAYLFSKAEKRNVWDQRLGPKTKPRIGLVWSGSSTHTNDQHRSLALAEVLQNLPFDFDYVSLQQEVRAEDQAALGSSAVQHFGEHLKDFTDTAALCDLMDVVVSVDTSVAHLAGALGKPTWVLLPYAPDWRWLLERQDSPWYDEVKLYRQDKDRCWAPVLKSVAHDLMKLNP